MPRYKCVVEYDGTHFSGWQRQKDYDSVQACIENALLSFCGEAVTIYTAGRTDAGVHALGQVCHFDLKQSFALERIRGGLNFYMHDKDVAIISAEEVAPEFHARFDAKKRYYEYRILNRRTPSVLNKYRVWHVPVMLDIQAMQNAAKKLIGLHDFTSFRDSQCQAKSALKTLDRLEVVKQNEEIIIYASAKSFLHHMVRNLVGTLVQVGEGKLFPDDMPIILDNKDRRSAGPTAPAQGLYFMRVEY